MEQAVQDSQNSIATSWGNFIDGAPSVQEQAMATLCHELRTPLTVMNGYLEILTEDCGEEMHEASRAIVRRLRLSALELSQTVENLLDWLGRQKRNGEPLMESFAAGEFLAEVAPAFEPTVVRKGLYLRWEVEHAPRIISSDRRMLRSIVFNLVANGLKFTDRGGVTVRMGAGPEGELRLEVRDTGIGIAPEHRARIFAPFTQLSQSDTRLYRGLGLGLALVERNLGLLGGRLEMDSQPGVGSIFRIEVPRAARA